MRYKRTQAEIDAERNAKIPGIRKMREEERTLQDISCRYGVSENYIRKVYKDIKVNMRGKNKKKKHTTGSRIGCITYSIDKLSKEDRERYMSLVPPIKGKDKEAYITANKGDYNKAVVFVDSHCKAPNYKY